MSWVLLVFPPGATVPGAAHGPFPTRADAEECALDLDQPPTVTFQVLPLH